MADVSGVRSESEEALLANLNKEQCEAVRHVRGPLLILAGAGSGKTRVITHRIAHLIQDTGVSPAHILAITFTNKAAAEMKNRIADLIGPRFAGMWVGTFHAMFLRMLRQHADRIGFSRDFAILDREDQQRLLRNCISDLDLDDKAYPVRNVHSRIGTLKNELVDPSAFGQRPDTENRNRRIADLYTEYQKRLKDANAMDFDDILFFAVRLLEQNEDLLDNYRRRFEHIMVDEYQDTNHAQYVLVQLLSGLHRNLCVVGDDDQSIYSFRGANIRNILDFEKDFPDCKVIKLERNYRSTGNVLQAANSVIRNNMGRKDKKLWTATGEGEPVTLFQAATNREEAMYVAGEISRKVARAGQMKYSEIAILYRLNALSRTLESAMREYGVPYRIFGGTRFYDRREIKDVLAYLRLILLPDDRISFLRIVNVPKRGIGDATIEHLQTEADMRAVSLLAMCARADEAPSLSRAAAKLKRFAVLMDELRSLLDQPDMTFAEFVEQVQEQSGIIQDLVNQREQNKVNETVDRIENMKELISDAVEFENSVQATVTEANPEYPEDHFEIPTDCAGYLRLYLEQTALYSDTDNMSDQEDTVRLMTIHSAKGLEFDTVFLIGAEEGLFPGYRSLGNEQGIEEERRLAYVAITRARRKLIITTARSRLLFGQTQNMMVSRFVNEIDEKYIESIGGSLRSQTGGGAGGLTSPARPSGQKMGNPQFPGMESFSSRTARNRPGKPPHKQTDTPDSLDPASIRKGDQVVHPRFGKGRIQAAEPVANDAILVIDFEEAGVKRMMARQARLTRS